MRKQSIEFLEALVTTPSPSGFEEKVQAVCRDYVRPFVDDVYKDVHGNQFAVRNRDAELRLMIAGHVDEIGLVVNSIDDKGFLSIVCVGGVDTAILGGHRVVVHTAKGPVPGVIGHSASFGPSVQGFPQPSRSALVMYPVSSTNLLNIPTVTSVLSI